MRLITTLVLCYFCCLVSLCPLDAQQAKPCAAFVVPHGSLPPLPQIYSCIRSLNGKPYEEGSAKACLNSILASGFFENGQIVLTPKEASLFVEFRLSAPKLEVTTVEFDADTSVKEQMLEWIRNTGQIIKVGDTYVDNRDERTAEVAEMFFRDLGKRAAVVRIVDLNYRNRTADLKYRIVLGPDIVRMRALPPFNPECNVPIHLFALTDVDDVVPLNLVEKLTKTHAFGCFDPKTLSEDENTLKKSNLFEEVRYNVERGSAGVDLSVHARGKPLHVSEVKTVGYGSLSGRSFPAEPALKLQPGGIYTRSTVRASLEFLMNKYHRSDQILELSEDDQLMSDNRLLVTLQLLGFPEDKVVVNGQEFLISPQVITGRSD